MHQNENGSLVEHLSSHRWPYVLHPLDSVKIDQELVLLHRNTWLQFFQWGRLRTDYLTRWPGPRKWTHRWTCRRRSSLQERNPFRKIVCRHSYRGFCQDRRNVQHWKPQDSCRAALRWEVSVQRPIQTRYPALLCQKQPGRCFLHSYDTCRSLVHQGYT